MEKCFNYLDGGRTDALDLQIALKQAEANTQTKNIDLKYFTVTFYKKGTCHIVFKDEERDGFHRHMGKNIIPK